MAVPALPALQSLTGGGALTASEDLGDTSVSTGPTAGGGTRAGGPSVVIAPTALNLGAILQNLQGPPENGGAGLDWAAPGFTGQNLRANGVEISKRETKVGNGFAIAAGVGLLGIVGFFLTRRR